MEIPLLDMNLNTADLGFAMIEPKIYDLRLKESEVIEPSTASDPPVWKLTFETTAPTRSVPRDPTQSPETIDPGHVLFTQTQLAPTGKATAKMVGQNVAEIVQAAKPPTQVGNLQQIRDWHKTLVGKMFRAEVIVQPAGVSKSGKAYKAGNRIDGFLVN